MFPSLKPLIFTVLVPLLGMSCSEQEQNVPLKAPVKVPETPKVEMTDLLMWEWDRGDVHEIYASDMSDGLSSRVTCARGWDRMPMGTASGEKIYLLSDRGIYEGVKGRRLYRRSFDELGAQEVKIGTVAKAHYDAYAIAPTEDIVAQVLDGDYPSTTVFDTQTGAILFTRRGCWAPSFSNDGTLLAMSCIPVLRERRDPWDPVRIEVVQSRTGASLYSSVGWSKPADPEKTKVAPGSGDDAATYNSPKFSPDGSKLAYSYYQPGSVEKPQVHIRNLNEATTLVLTASEKPCLNPVWSPKGSHVFYLSYDKDESQVMRAPISGGEAQTFGPVGGKIRNLSSLQVPKSVYQSWHPCAPVPAISQESPEGVVINPDPQTHITTERPEVAHKLRARFEYQLSLAGFQLDRIEPEPKHLTLHCRILFEVHHRPPGNFEVGIELKSKDHTITKKFSPLPGDFAPYMWQEGQWVLGEYLLPVGYDIPPGTYFMNMWLYSPRGNIPITESDGHLHTQENTMPLVSIILR